MSLRANTTLSSKVGILVRSFFQTRHINFMLMLRLRCVCSAVPQKGSVTKSPCAIMMTLHGLSHRSSSRRMHMSSTLHILRSKEWSRRSSRALGRWVSTFPADSIGPPFQRFTASTMNICYWLGYHLSRLVGRLFFHFRVIHRERMIQTGPVILAMNHQSYLDPPLAGITCDRAIYFLAKRTLMNTPLLRWFLPKLNVIPVNQEGIDRSALKALIRVLKSGNAALVFPEGSRTLDGSLQPAEPGLGLVIAKTLAPVVPMRIFGAHEALPRGGGGLHLVPITVVVGEPIFFTEADLQSSGKDLYGRLSQRVMDAIVALHL